jgi:hypothetical protein
MRKIRGRERVRIIGQKELARPKHVIGPVHLAYNTSLFSLFFQPEQYFSLTKNQSTVFSAGL